MSRQHRELNTTDLSDSIVYKGFMRDQQHLSPAVRLVSNTICQPRVRNLIRSEKLREKSQARNSFQFSGFLFIVSAAKQEDEGDS